MQPQVLNLTIHCTDRPGLLAEIAQIIADHGHNIKVRAALSSVLWGLPFLLHNTSTPTHLTARALSRSPRVS